MLLKKQTLFISFLLIFIVRFSGSAFSQTAPDSARAARASALRELSGSIEGVAKESPQIFKTKDGYLRFVGAPPESESYSGKSYPFYWFKKGKERCMRLV